MKSSLLIRSSFQASRNRSLVRSAQSFGVRPWASAGAGFYTGHRFHVDSSGFRKWGANGKGATSPCVTRA